MEYDDKNNPISEFALLKTLIESLISRQNEQSAALSEARTELEALTLRMDEASHMTSEEYGAQVVQHVMLAMPAIQAAALKATKRGGRR